MGFDKNVDDSPFGSGAVLDHQISDQTKLSQLCQKRDERSRREKLSKSQQNRDSKICRLSLFCAGLSGVD
jgi:hypothetical protein